MFFDKIINIFKTSELCIRRVVYKKNCFTNVIFINSALTDSKIKKCLKCLFVAFLHNCG